MKYWYFSSDINNCLICIDVDIRKLFVCQCGAGKNVKPKFCFLKILFEKCLQLQNCSNNIKIECFAICHYLNNDSS